MADLFPVNGAKIYIGTASMAVPDTGTVAVSDFAAVSWTQISDWSNMGPLGDSANLITTQIIDRGRDLVQKGTKKASPMANKFVVNATDAGQLALIAAEATSYNYPFKVVFNDAPSGGTATSKYFIALVTDVSEDGGGANSARLMNGTLQSNTNIATTEAAP